MGNLLKRMSALLPALIVAGCLGNQPNNDDLLPTTAVPSETSMKSSPVATTRLTVAASTASEQSPGSEPIGISEEITIAVIDPED